MKAVKLSWIGLCLSTLAILLSGCNEQQQINSLQLQNRTQADRIATLEAQLKSTQIETQQLENQLRTARGEGQVSVKSKDAEIQALEKALLEKNQLIADMQAQLLKSGVKLPMELSIMLQDFAANTDIVTYDSATGCLKFKSDLLFQPGSDIVNAEASKTISQLCSILNSDMGKKFDVIIAGHTDDMRIARAETRAKHPTNWHLSAHRAISVLNQMSQSNIDSKRLSVRGFGEFRPLEPNNANKKGNPKNRRVEIYIVPQGA